ncbi:MAG: hypothetical protein JWM40_401 [Frankiales bacterium]|nr:hypothetical protein [Frankiales bacterium]
MNLEELFGSTARIGEPDLPPDVLGGVRSAQTRRRRRLLIAAPVVCAAIAAGLHWPTAVLGREPTGPAGLVSTPTASASPTETEPAVPAPPVVVGISGSHAERLDLFTGARTDLGPARSITLHRGQPWLSRPGATCHDTVVTPNGSFDPHGEVPVLEVSPDGKTLAFYRQTGPASVDYPNMLCASRFLVLRDVATGVERSWAANDGSLEGLSWSADSRRLAFTFRGCCGDDSPIVQVLDTSAPPGDLDGIAALPNGPDGCEKRLPVFSGQTLLVVVRCYIDNGTSPSTDELRDASSDTQVMALNPDTDTVTADVSGQHLLVFSYSPGPTLKLVAINVRQRSSRPLSEPLSSAHW